MEVIKVDYHNEKQMSDLLFLLNCYAEDPMGGGEPVSEEVTKQLPEALQARNFVFSLIVYIDGKPAGLTNCIESFSTFACRPVVNIHDFAINPEYRGQGVSQVLLNEIEKIAREKGSAKITLEVLSGNKVAINAYKKFGFNGYELDPNMGKAEFWEKKLK